MIKFKNLSIYKKIFLIGIPVVLENLVYNLINFIDNFMVGKENPTLGLGTNAVAGLGISNQLFFVFIVSLFGIFSGASVLSAQYFGNKDYKNMNKILGFLCIASVIISIPFLLIGIFFPEYLLSFYTKDELTLIQATNYFRVACLTFPLAGLGFAFSMQLRVISESKYAFYASIVGLMFNFFGNTLLIPILGVQGAAIATVIARLFTLIYMIYISKKKKFPIISKIKDMIPREIALIKDIAKISFPTFLHELIWVLGMNFRSAMYSNTTSLEYAAVVIAITISSVVFSVFSGVSNAASVLIGNELGANRLDKAELVSKICIKLTLFLGLFSTLFINLVSPLVLSIMGMSEELRILSRSVIFADSFVYAFKASALLFIVGILRAGGDIVYAMMLDLVGMWVVSIPITYYAKEIMLPINIIFLLSSLSDVVVCIPAIYRYRQKKWLKRIIKD